MEITGHEEMGYGGELTASTSKGIKYRLCPCCKKEFKMELLGSHVKIKHPKEYEALFTNAEISACIESQTLIKCKVAYDDSDVNFLHCFACNSIRTTDRGHFKDKEEHLKEHIALAQAMSARKTGVVYIPASIGELQKYKNKLFTTERLYKQSIKDCYEEHGQFEIHNAVNLAEIARLSAENDELKQELKDALGREKVKDRSIQLHTNSL